MSTTYTTGTWRPRAGKEREFVEAWAAFAEWAATMPGCGTLRLTRDLGDGGVFVSFGDWESAEAVRGWKSTPDFRERIAHVLQHVDGFEPSELALVATAASAAA
jgi:heme-degrading monooxygenase HmoA